ncbi:MAG: radical SAM protein [Burkholderiaceae bacterium]|nr:radical SAM protein [Burkholderiaceae bacterium]
MQVEPRCLTVLATYKCTAECKECCFESSPRLKQRLTLEEIKSAIRQAHRSFPSIEVVVFSGGETFLLKDDLISAIAYATELGLLTRCVTNGFWGKAEHVAHRTVQSLVAAGLTEINISTGADHQEFVPFASVETASRCLVEGKIRTLVTIEADKPDGVCMETALNSPIFGTLLREQPGLFSLQSNSWMPFKTNYEDRRVSLARGSLETGCKQLLTNIVVTPYKKMSACCGLTFEHIPELTLGDLNDENMTSLYEMARKDFLKIWIHTDGPSVIMRKLFGEDIDDDLAQFKHICQACVVLHKHPTVRAEIRRRYAESMPDVLAR